MNVFIEFIAKNKIILLAPPKVIEESYTNPVSTKRLELNAFRIKKSITSRTVKESPITPQVRKDSLEIMALANSAFSVDGSFLQIVHEGEAECLALAKNVGAKAIFMDERTTRALIENPGRLRGILERRQDKRVEMNLEPIEKLRELIGEIKFFRSIEILAIAYEQGLFAKELEESDRSLEAVLYACKFNGCAVSENQILDYLREKNN
jgi:predicted nucleic acid-binding protein